MRIKKFFGAIIMTSGILLMIFTGGCTAFELGIAISGIKSFQDVFGLFFMFILWGVIPFGISYFMYKTGRSLMHMTQGTEEKKER